MKTFILAMAAVLTGIPAASAKTAWKTIKRNRLVISSSKGKALLTYRLQIPAKWTYVKRSVGCFVFPPKRRDVVFAVKPIHKGDAGPEQLLNKKYGLRKWVARVQKGTRVTGVHKIKAGKKVREVLEAVDTRRARAMFFYVMLLRVKDVNIVLLAGGPQSEQIRLKRSIWPMFRRFTATSP